MGICCSSINPLLPVPLVPPPLPVLSVDELDELSGLSVNSPLANNSSAASNSAGNTGRISVPPRSISKSSVASESGNSVVVRTNSWKFPGSSVTPESAGKGGRRLGSGTRTNWTLSGLLLVCLMGMVAGGFRVEAVVVLGLVLGFLVVVVVVVVVFGRDVLGFGVVVVVVVVVVVAALLVVDDRRVVVVDFSVVLGLAVDGRVTRGPLIISGLAESGSRGVDW